MRDSEVPSEPDENLANAPTAPASRPADQQRVVVSAALTSEVRGHDDLTAHRVADQGDVDALSRDELADRRDDSGDRRDRSGDRRDRSRDRRHRVLDLLDEQAARADSAAGERYRIASCRATRYADGRIDPQLAAQSAVDREHSRVDRERAEQDRRASAAERVEAQLDRSTASTDRTASFDDRSHSGLDRSTALDQRTSAAVARGIATFDDLTGAYRRGPGLTELDREIARSTRTGESLVLAYIDVDGLKAVNDSLGHEAGDSLLIEVAGALASHLRPYDVVIRVGGDEFVCICEDITAADADVRFTQLNEELARNGHSISVGLAELQAHDTTSSFLARADHAMYVGRDER